MEFANNKHQIQYLFPRQTSAPQSALTKTFPSVSLTDLTDSICIDLFGQFASESSGANNSADSNHPKDAKNSKTSKKTKTAKNATNSQDASTVTTVGSTADETYE